MSHVKQLLEMRNFFQTRATLSVSYRKKQLEKLKAALQKHEQDIYNALHTDLKKSPEESWITENGFVTAELNNALRNIERWAKPEKVKTNLVNIPSSSYVYAEPLGVVLIIAPWNYPMNLLFTPLIGAIAAGNCVMLKASEFAPATAVVMEKIITETFEASYINITSEVGEQVIPAMMNNFTFDHVFYTGSTAVGKIIYEMAAKQLVPVTLELGGKSPCVVEEEVNIAVAAKRIAMTKFSNAGQMCVAPDYVLVHENNKDALVNEIKNALIDFFGNDPSISDFYGKIINSKQFDRLSGYLKDGTVVHGGQVNNENLYIAPTLLTDVTLESGVMQDEIFGPVLPILTFKNTEDAMAIISKNKNPLAFYIFTSNKQKEQKWLTTVPFGGGCVNNAALHLTNHNLPFGGRGYSGTGQYHGVYSFKTFSHLKSVMKTPTWFDPSAKYPPYNGKLKILKWLIR